jgi:aminoglycoside phosphotransferase (APT) family kinase protein
MTEVGELLAKGRAADVFAYGEGLVLRRYRTPMDCTYEANVMRHVAAHGYPVPEVVQVSGGDLVMERLDGTTMLEDFSKYPWRMLSHAATLADLMKRLHEIEPPEWLADKVEGGTSIVHLDLHPDNVMLTSRGPVVIDWSNAGRGDPNAEVADLWLVMSCADAPVSGLERALVKVGRNVFVKRFLRNFDLEAVKPKLRVAAAHRGRDRNMSETEKQRMQELVERYS